MGDEQVFRLGPFPDIPGYEEAQALDREDPLAGFRHRFVITDPDLIYLDGNSLGRLSRRSQNLVSEVVAHQWGDRLIRSWNEGWWEMQLRLGDLLAPLLGAGSGEVVISDSTSVNLFKLAAAAVKARHGRSQIITDDLNFPTDVYVLDGVARLFALGEGVEIVASDGINGPVEALAGALSDDTALVSLSHTVFKSGFTYDMAEITRLVHEAGALILWDCSHSVGSLPIDLGAAGADLAVGCTYKHLNGGPGSPAFLYVRRELQDELTNPITAWWGHAEPFAFDLEFQPVEGIRRFHTGTMPILSLAALEPALDDILEAGIDRIRAKSVQLTEFFIGLCDDQLTDLGFGLASPRDPGLRGSHLSLRHPDAWPIAQAMIEVARVIPDFRAPDNLRLGFSPLYTTYLEVHTAVARIRRLVEEGQERQFADTDLAVT